MLRLLYQKTKYAALYCRGENSLLTNEIASTYSKKKVLLQQTSYLYIASILQVAENVQAV